jgi:hypothetical protein
MHDLQTIQNRFPYLYIKKINSNKKNDTGEENNPIHGNVALCHFR